MDSYVTEMYLTDGEIVGSKYLLMVKSDGTVELNWYNGDTKKEMEKPCLTRCLKGMKVIYGVPNNMGIRPSMEVIDYDSGKLATRWKQLK